MELMFGRKVAINIRRKSKETCKLVSNNNIENFRGMYLILDKYVFNLLPLPKFDTTDTIGFLKIKMRKVNNQ